MTVEWEYMDQIKIRAFILDFGGVISEPQNPENVNNILKILNQGHNDFKSVYRGKRGHYDSGEVSAEEYWHDIFRYYGLEYDVEKINRLIQEDVLAWTHINDQMLHLMKKCRDKVHKMAVISNMTRDTLVYMNAHFKWLSLFDVLVYSCDIGVNKPAKKIYDVCLKRLDIPAHECLFVDDSLENVQGAVNAGINGIHYRSFLQFRREFEDGYSLSF